MSTEQDTARVRLSAAPREEYRTTQHNIGARGPGDEIEEFAMSTDTMTQMERFRLVREQLQAQREKDRERVQYVGVRVEDVAEEVALSLDGRIARRGDRWVSLADGRALPHAVIVAAVLSLLPDEYQGDRREWLADVVAASSTLRGLLA